ncbi:hypothetical protein SAMN04487926_13082 [Paraburkholderia steynii]|uniref:Uncharacterized protein n=1 Tax=Paraburkholderia steynii TaxID=1245441 RepID=A0A7Z7BEI0_9BURK|nr:hypothetical protein SAMN04487926_13082 [Paraburkholderia steynii]
MSHHLAFSRSQTCHPRLNVCLLPTPLEICHCTVKCAIYSLKQNFLNDWLGHKVKGASFHCIHACIDITVSSNEDDWKFHVQSTLNFEPAQIR